MPALRASTRLSLAQFRFCIALSALQARTQMSLAPTLLPIALPVRQALSRPVLVHPVSLTASGVHKALTRPRVVDRRQTYAKTARRASTPTNGALRPPNRAFPAGPARGRALLAQHRMRRASFVRAASILRRMGHIRLVIA